MKILKYAELINENKMWYKTIPQILEWLSSKSNLPWIFLDTETTGLGGPKKQQLTQVSAIVTQYDFKSNNFSEIGKFDEKIKLTDETKSKFETPEDKTKWVLGFNHYGSGKYKYKNERDIVEEFFNWCENYSPNILVAQNASFDMAMLSGRFGHKIKNEVFDTKMLIQLYYLPLLQTLSEVDSKYKQMVDAIGTSERDSGLISSSMSKIGPALGLNMTNYHDAITDCRITIQMYQKIVEFLKQHQEVDIMKYQLERIKVIRSSK
jgi:DNA polymerase III epsilon subunit-like protein